MSSSRVEVQISRIREGFEDIALPEYQTIGSAGVDLPAAVSEEVILKAGEFALLPTSFAIALPVGFEAQVRPRSGLAVKHGVTVLNSPGTIDSDYRGEIRVALINHSKTDFVIKRGERIAQMIVAPVTQAQWVEVQELGNTERGAGGFGHTGR